MSDFEIKVIGIEELMNRLSGSKIASVATKSMNQGGKYLTGWIKKNRLTGARPRYLGVVTGRLRASISSSKPERVAGGLVVKIGTNVVYGRIHEFGGYAGRNRSTYIRPRPFLRPALESRTNQLAIINIFTRNVNDMLEKIK